MTSEFLKDFPVDVESLKAERKAKAQFLFSQYGLDALVAWSGAAYSERAAVRWYTNYFSDDLSVACVVRKDGQTTLLVPYIVEIMFADQQSWADQHRHYEDLLQGLVKEIHLIGPKRVGVIGLSATLGSIELYLREHLPQVEFVDLDGPFNEMRLLKGEIETQLFRQTGQIVDHAFTEFVKNFRSGMTEAEVKGEIHRGLYSAGAEASLVLVSTNERVIQQVPLRRPISSGDILQISIEAAGPGGYWIQTVRSFAIDEVLDRRVSDLTASCVSALQAAVDHMRPGHKLRELINLADSELKPTLKKIQASQLYPYGHGMGLNTGEGYGLTDEVDLEIAPGLIVVFHPNGYGETFGTFLGNTYVISDQGPECLSEFPIELAIL